MKTLTWTKLEHMLPLLNTSELERRCELRKGRIRDVKHSKSSFSNEELQRIFEELKKTLTL